MIKFPAWWPNTDRSCEIAGAAGLIFGAVGVVPLIWLVTHRVADGMENCWSVLSRQYGDSSCSHMLGTAARPGLSVSARWLVISHGAETEGR
jgi:hypothetical protein